MGNNGSVGGSTSQPKPTSISDNVKMKYDEQRAKMPTVFVSFVDPKDDFDDVYVLYPQKMEFHIDCYVQTALVNMVGFWKNQTDRALNAVFMIPMRGKVTDCYIHIGSNRVRSIRLAQRDLQSIPGPFGETKVLRYYILTMRCCSVVYIWNPCTESKLSTRGKGRCRDQYSI